MPIQMHTNVTRCLTARPVQTDEDWWRIRRLLIETYPITPTGFNWEIRRWDGWRFHRADTDWLSRARGRTHLWENETGRLIGVVHPEGSGDAWLELHPGYRSIESDMIAWAEEHLSEPTDGGRRQLQLFVFDYDSPRRRLLDQRGYEKMPWTGVTRRLRFGNWPLPDVQYVEGYHLRTTCPGNEGDYQRVADILNAGFNRTSHRAAEIRNFMTLSPSFRPELDLVAEGPDGSFAAYVGITYDEANRRGIFEPVCTHPDHLRRGLARMLMVEGLHLLKALGATDMYVETGDAAPANALYDCVGFTEAYTGTIWRKVF
ncbi:MAG TPA: GNAT family N-acetyltransferase [Aggregatilineales bacterium]|nr:GNAT family N-acetyltransferase [Aggregatilineales bacterium]